MSSLFEHIRMHWIGFNSFKHSYNWYSNFGVFFKSKHLRWKKNDLLYLNRDDTPVIWYRTKIKFINHFICMTYFPHFPARKQIYFFYCTWKIFMVIFQVCHIKLISIKWKENQLPVTSVYKFTDELPAIDMHLVIYIW